MQTIEPGSVTKILSRLWTPALGAVSNSKNAVNSGNAERVTVSSPRFRRPWFCHPQFILDPLVAGIIHLDPLVAGIIHKFHRDVGQGMDQLRQIPNTMGLGGLIENPDPLTRCRRMIDGQFDAANGIAEVDEGPGLK